MSSAGYDLRITSYNVCYTKLLRIIAGGKTEIEVPEGARVSAAAADLIKDKKLKVKTVAAQRTREADAPQAGDKPPAVKSPPHPAKAAKTDAQTISGNKKAASGDELSDKSYNFV